MIQRKGASWLVTALLVAACASDPPARSAPGPSSVAPVPPYAIAPAPVPDIGLRVTFTPWPPTRPSVDPAGGPALTDIMTHEPPAEDLRYDDAVTLGHETTHAINNAIRNAASRGATVANGFYVMNGWGVAVNEPRVRKSQVAALVPPSLRSGRYTHYLLGAPGWENRSLYLWDEWDAYTNGATVAVDRYTRGLDRFEPGTVNDNLFAVLEMTVFALTTGMAAAVYDPLAFASDAQLRAFLAWQAERAMTVFRAGIVLPPYRWHETDGFYAALRSSPDAEALRQFVRTTYGAAWAYAVLGI
jgi:hypothetical protein